MKHDEVPVSWVDGYGNRLFGKFLRWDADDKDYAICVRFTRRCRIYKANLTFEVG